LHVGRSIYPSSKLLRNPFGVFGLFEQMRSQMSNVISAFCQGRIYVQSATCIMVSRAGYEGLGPFSPGTDQREDPSRDLKYTFESSGPKEFRATPPCFKVIWYAPLTRALEAPCRISCISFCHSDPIKIAMIVPCFLLHTGVRESTKHSQTFRLVRARLSGINTRDLRR